MAGCVRRSPYAGSVAHVEFTIEPFVEGQPGPHVTAAIDAASRSGEVEVGPFGSSCRVGLDAVGDLVRELTDAAFEHGATHVTIHVARDDQPSAPAAHRGDGS